MKLDRALRMMIATGVLLAVAGATGCSGGDDPGPGAGGQSGATATGGTNAGGAGGTSVGGSGGTTTPTSACGTGGSGGAAGTYPNVGVKGERGQATADATTFDGWEESFIIGEQGFGTDVCAVRFDLKRVGDAPAGCADCSWTHLVEYSNPRVMTDVDGVCAKSDLALTADAIAKKVGTRIALGFAKEVGGAHGSARFMYFECTKAWDISGNATWDEPAKSMKYTFRNGNCTYGP